MDADLTNAALRALRRILRAADLSGRRLAAETGLTASQLLVLQEVERRGQTTPGSIAMRLQLSQATVTNIMDRLEAEGLASRRRNEGDRRQQLLAVTSKGKSVLETAPNLLRAQFSRRFGELAPWEQAMILAALERLGELLDDTETAASPLAEASAADRTV